MPLAMEAAAPWGRWTTKREESREMREFVCRLLGHDRMTTSTRQRICLRCGARETLRNFSHVIGWEEEPRPAIRGSKA
jgi:hypothetical protein